MPKSNSERNKEYRRRLLAKARAWDRVAEGLAQIREPTNAQEAFDVMFAFNSALKDAALIAEQVNG